MQLVTLIVVNSGSSQASNHGGSVQRTAVIRIVLLVVCAAAIGGVAWFVPIRPYVIEILQWAQGAGPTGMLVLAALYIPACLLFIPGWPLTVGAGFVFGVVRGTIAVSLGSVLGASAAFGAGRTLARRLIEDRVSRNPRFAAIDQAVGEHGFKIVLLTRLSPVFPFNLLNYAFGLTTVSFRDYVLASWIGMLPGTILYAYLGSAAASLAELFTSDIRIGPLQIAQYTLGLLATVVVTVLIGRIARRAIDRTIREGQGSSVEGLGPEESRV